MQTIRIAYFGDSITECLDIPKERTWPALCTAASKEQFAANANIESDIFAVCGENTRQALERMQPKVQSQEAEVMTILFGANDSDYWLSNRGVPVVSEPAFKANLVEMIDRARTFKTKKIILITTHSFATTRVEINEKTHSENLLPYNQIICDVADEHNCELVDMHKILSDEAPESYTKPLPDGVHLSEAGCRLYADAIQPVLNKCIQSIIDES